MRRAPPGMRLARSLGSKEWSRNSHRCLVLVLTFVAYACYHASRKPTSIVKSVLDPDSHPPRAYPQPSLSSPPLPWPLGPLFLPPNPLGRPHSQGWAPFNGTDGTAKLGEIDVAFLACYSLGMYAAGHLGDRLDLRFFLAAGMIGSGVFVGLFGMGYFWRLHVFGFYLAMQMLAGLLQATGWPSVVAVVGNWFGERKRGLNGNLERPPLRREHRRLAPCRQRAPVWVGLVLHSSRGFDCPRWGSGVPVLGGISGGSRVFWPSEEGLRGAR